MKRSQRHASSRPRSQVRGRGVSTGDPDDLAFDRPRAPCLSKDPAGNQMTSYSPNTDIQCRNHKLAAGERYRGADPCSLARAFGNGSHTRCLAPIAILLTRNRTWPHSKFKATRIYISPEQDQKYKPTRIQADILCPSADGNDCWTSVGFCPHRSEGGGVPISYVIS